MYGGVIQIVFAVSFVAIYVLAGVRRAAIPVKYMWWVQVGRVALLCGCLGFGVFGLLRLFDGGSLVSRKARRVMGDIPIQGIVIGRDTGRHNEVILRSVDKGGALDEFSRGLYESYPWDPSHPNTLASYLVHVKYGDQTDVIEVNITEDQGAVIYIYPNAGNPLTTYRSDSLREWFAREIEAHRPVLP